MDLFRDVTPCARHTENTRTIVRTSTTDEDGNHRPCENFQHLGISQSKVRKQIYNHKVRKNIAADEEPPVAVKIEHIDNEIETEEKSLILRNTLNLF